MRKYVRKETERSIISFGISYNCVLRYNPISNKFYSGMSWIYGRFSMKDRIMKIKPSFDHRDNRNYEKLHRMIEVEGPDIAMRQKEPIPKLFTSLEFGKIPQ